MTTKQMEPDVDPWREQQDRQRKSLRKEKVTTLAVVAAIGLGTVAWVLGTRGAPAQNRITPAAEPPTVVPAGADQVGLVGLAPEVAKPSLPTRGELVLGFRFAHTPGDAGRFRVFVYADGRLIWQRFADPTVADQYSKDYTTGLLEQRLTHEGVDLVRADVVSIGLFDHDLHLESGQGLTYGGVDVRNGDQLVHVDWGQNGDQDVAREMPTPQQASALRWLDARLADPAAWLPASAWENPQITAYVPSGYSVCYDGRQGQELSQVLGSLPAAAEELLRTQDRTRGQAPAFIFWCSDLTNEQARALAQILDDAGQKGDADAHGLRYGDPGATEVSFEPLLPLET